jgi:hypothetical protein
VRNITPADGRFREYALKLTVRRGDLACDVTERELRLGVAESDRQVGPAPAHSPHDVHGEGHVGVVKHDGATQIEGQRMATTAKPVVRLVA